jgi:hypothetical protein
VEQTPTALSVENAKYVMGTMRHFGYDGVFAKDPAYWNPFSEALAGAVRVAS